MEIAHDVPILDLPEVIAMCGDNIRPLVEGSALVKKGVLNLGRLAESDEETLHVFALVVQASHIKENPHQVKIRISGSGKSKTIEAECTCRGGGHEKCKHVIATALKLYTKSAESLDPVSCTELTQAWGKKQMKALADEEYSGVKLSEQCHFRPATHDNEKIAWDASFEPFCRTELMRVSQDSALAISSSLSRWYADPVDRSTLPVHKSVIRAVKTVEAEKRKSCSGASVSTAPEFADVVAEVEEALRKCKLPPCPSACTDPMENLIREQIQSLGAILSDILPNVGLLEEEPQDESVEEPVSGAPAAQSTPQRPPAKQRKSTEVSPLTSSPLANLSPIIPGKTPRHPLGQLQTSAPGPSRVTEVFHSPMGVPSRSNKENTSKKLTNFEKKKLYNENVSWRLHSPKPTFQPISQNIILEAMQPELHEVFGVCMPDTLELQEAMLYMENVDLSEESAVQLCLETVIQSDSKAWDFARLLRFTSSWVHKVFRCRNKVDNNSEWDKTFSKKLGKPFAGSWTTKRGLDDEPYAKQVYEKQRQCKVVEAGLFVHPSLPWLGGSADGFVVEERKIIECKSPERGITEPPSCYIFELDYVTKCPLGKPMLRRSHEYFTQVQQTMALTSFHSCDFIIYSSLNNSIEIIDVPYDPDFAKELIQKVTCIYFKHFLRALLQHRSNQQAN